MNMFLKMIMQKIVIMLIQAKIYEKIIKKWK